MENLKARLEAAERVCRFYGWAPARSDTDVDKATYMAWARWTALVPAVVLRPTAEDEGEIARLAVERDAVRERTLAAGFLAA